MPYAPATPSQRLLSPKVTLFPAIGPRTPLSHRIMVAALQSTSRAVSSAVSSVSVSTSTSELALGRLAPRTLARRAALRILSASPSASPPVLGPRSVRAFACIGKGWRRQLGDARVVRNRQLSDARVMCQGKRCQAQLNPCRSAPGLIWKGEAGRIQGEERRWCGGKRIHVLTTGSTTWIVSSLLGREGGKRVSLPSRR